MRGTAGGEDSTNSDIDGYIKNWLKGAPDRDGGRKLRKQKAQCQQDRHSTQLEADADSV